MSDGQILTLEEFLDTRFDLPEAGQWAELVSGRVELLQPPDLDHGTVILNFSKQVASWTAATARQRGDGIYAAFDLGLILRQNPDTVRFPAVSFFSGGERFAELDKLATGTVPRLVVELASSSDRRRMMPQRVADYLAWGVPEVWTIDPRQRAIVVHTPGLDGTPLAGEALLTGRSVLPGFEMPVAALFAEPSWWTGQRQAPLASLPHRRAESP